MRVYKRLGVVHLKDAHHYQTSHFHLLLLTSEMVHLIAAHHYQPSLVPLLLMKLAITHLVDASV